MHPYNYMLDMTEGYYLENKDTKVLTRIINRDQKGNYILFEANDRIGGMFGRNSYTPVEMIRLLKTGDYKILHVTSMLIHLVPTMPYLRAGDICTPYASNHKLDECEVLADRNFQ